MSAVTYVPRDGDPVSVTWAGHRFHANEPRDVTHPEILKSAATNPWFKVEGSAESEQTQRVNKGGRPAKPKTQEEYRAFAIGWINKAETYDGLMERWKAEQDMRDKLGVGTDDYDFIDGIMNPRAAELKKAAS